ncbi:MAG: hypothetical protein HYT72_04650 [Candidatus Aenigmarchaeota archaeon]|nr:hypothetical protein [Candidatus Aenigmarchaeota archaeon]
MAKNAKCTCNMGMMLVALVIMSVGAFVLVAGLANQFKAAEQLSQATAMAVLPLYFAGMLVLFIGKMAKWKSHGACPAHGGKM